MIIVFMILFLFFSFVFIFIIMIMIILIFLRQDETLCLAAHMSGLLFLLSLQKEQRQELSCFIWDALRPPTVSSYRNASGERRERWKTGDKQEAAERVMCIL